MQDTHASERELWETADSEGDDARTCGESESLSDIDDAEVDSYLNDEKEKHYKKIIWEKLNQKYIQEQEAKKAAAAHAAKPKKLGPTGVQGLEIVVSISLGLGNALPSVTRSFCVK